MKFSAPLLMIALLFLSASAAADSYTYKWKANDGTIQYTQFPPTDRPYTRVKISSSTSSVVKKESTAAAKAPAVPDDASAGEKALAETEAMAQQEKIKIAQQRAAACEQAKKNLIIMQSRPRIRVPTANGDYRVLSEKEKQEKIKETKQVILDACN